MDLETQIALGKLVSPITGKALLLDPDNESLITEDHVETYSMNGSTPILLKDTENAKLYIATSSRMTSEYSVVPAPSKRRSLKSKISSYLKERLDLGYARDYRTPSSQRAFDRIFNSDSNRELYLAIGGGPTRQHPNFTNLNIGPFHNVDVVADAHQLPYGSGTVDAIHCEAVLEHLIDPTEAVKEMLRVLKPGGSVFAATPFMAAYHGYPNHFQNFTLTGHQSLFSRCGFELLESGVCVGPFCSLVDLIGVYISQLCPPGWVERSLFKAWRLIGLFIRRLDKHFNSHNNAFMLAATTYVVARKPEL